MGQGEKKPYHLVLLNATREELIEAILDKDREIEKLRIEIERLKAKLNPEKPKAKKDKEELQTRTQSKPPEEWGQKAGHRGSGWKKPDHIDREVEKTLTSCPDCHHRLSGSQEVVEHIQLDIVPAKRKVTRYKRHRYWCSSCKKIVEAPYAKEEIPAGHIGPIALITMIILRYHHGLPVRKIKELLGELCGLNVTPGAITQALGRLAYWLKVETDIVLEALRNSPFLHMDETGWKINGANHWLWTMVNNRLAYHRIDRSRGSKVAKALIGNDFKGILISDFYSAYNKLAAKQQKCLVHLLREIRELKARDPTEGFLIPYKKLKRLINDALRLNKQRHKLEGIVFNRRRQRLEERLIDFACSIQSHKDWQRLSNRILKHHRAILTFLYHKNIPSNNNAAERAIRPHVIIRNRSYQSRTQRGADTHTTLTSLLYSLQLQGKDPMENLKLAYLKHRKGNAESALFAKA